MPVPPKDLPNRDQMLTENPTLIDRFESKVEKPDQEHRCWLWTGAKQRGYSCIRIKMEGKWHSIGAHRISYVLGYGEIPQGLYIAHLCDIPLCVNPDHLFPCTHRLNMADRAASNRIRRHLNEHGLTDVEIIAGSISSDMLEEE